ncbi:MAG: hypothetical protein K2H21_00380 [Muribaculaceae bacterium]|nr:hypothetical protein [Muribaculaceae bacterium]
MLAIAIHGIPSGVTPIVSVVIASGLTPAMLRSMSPLSIEGSLHAEYTTRELLRACANTPGHIEPVE